MNRRQFLGAAAGAVAGTALVPNAWAAAATSAWRMRLSTSTIQFKELSLEDACRQIAALGFEAVDIWSGYEGCRHLDEALERLGPTGLKAVLQDTRLKLNSFSTYVGGYARYAELLGKVGGGVAIQGSAGPCEPAQLRSRMKAFLEELKPLVALAEKNNSYLAIENHGQALLDSLDSFKAFVDLNTSPRLGIALAPYHVQAGGASVPDAIRACGGQLLFFYAWQNAPGLQQLPGHGPADFKPWLKALAEINYRGYVNPFMHGHPETEAMSAGLRKAKAYLIEQARE